MEWSAEAWVAGYAAIVATGALALEVRRWVESGPKIFVDAKPNMNMITQGKGPVEKGFLIVDVANRGALSTTITTLAILEFPDRLTRWHLRPIQSFIVPKPYLPGAATALPFVVEPGKQWIGIARPDEDVMGDVQSGTMWVAIYTTDRARPYLARIPKRMARPELTDAVAV